MRKVWQAIHWSSFVDRLGQAASAVLSRIQKIDIRKIKLQKINLKLPTEKYARRAGLGLVVLVFILAAFGVYRWLAARDSGLRADQQNAVPAEQPGPVEQSKIFGVQFGSPVYLRAYNHLDEGCTWLGVAGQVFQRDGSPAKDVAVMVTGSLNGELIERAVVVEPDGAYGPSGYEIQLAQRPPASTSSVTVQLYNLQSQPLSEPVAVRIPDRCEQNLVLVNFRAGNAQMKDRLFLPVTGSQSGP